MKKITLFFAILIFILAGVSCKKKNTDDTVYYYASFKIDGTAKQFKTTSNFNKFCIVPGVCNDFWGDPSDQSKNRMSIGFPTDVAAGKTYTKNDSHVQLIYMDGQGKTFFSSSYDSLAIHIDTWEGSGGWVKGTFSGLLKYYSDNPSTMDSVFVSDGTFAGKIWFTIQE